MCTATDDGEPSPGVQKTAPAPWPSIERAFRFNAEVTRDGPYWNVFIVELDKSARANGRIDIASVASQLIILNAGVPHDDYDVVMWSERDCVRARADEAGFTTLVNAMSRTDTYDIAGRSVWVRYGSYEMVVGVQASDEVFEFQPDRDGAFDALGIASNGSAKKFAKRHQIGPPLGSNGGPNNKSDG